MEKRKNILNPVLMFVTGLGLGFFIRLLDMYTQNLGNIFSRMAIWILMGVLISIYSRTKKRAMLNILLFCVGMLITYYFVEHVTNGVYSDVYIIGWTAFAFASPLLAYFTWIAKEKGVFPKIISIGIVAVLGLTSIFFFERLRIDDFIIDGLLVYFLFFKKIKR